MMKIPTLVIIGAAVHLGGCGIVDKRVESPEKLEASFSEVMPQLDLIATDFVNALRQLDAVPAFSTTVALQGSLRNDQFTRSMLSALQKAGYAIRWVEDQGTNLLFQYRHSVEVTKQDQGSDTYELAIGAIEMRRTYTTAGPQVQPLTPLYVRGTDATGVVLNDDLFVRQTEGIANRRKQNNLRESYRPVEELQAARVNPVPLQAKAQIQRNTSPALALQNSSSLQLPADANPLNPLIGRVTANTAGTLSQQLAVLPREENVFVLGASNFEDALSGHRVVSETVLTFANDSMRLGESNKNLVERLVSRYDPRTDVFSVIGCSLGHTTVNGGNAALALGRAGRVVEALRFAGVDDGHILDEGCWAGDGSLDNLPKRGVVLTLNRQV